MRNPNGYGTVVKLKGNRRRPYAVRKTTGWNEKGHPILITIGYYATREEGMIALAAYNKAPWDIDTAKTTFKELFELWKEKKAFKLGKKNQESMFSAYHHCKSVHGMKYQDIKSYHMQECIDNCGRGYSTQRNIKNLLNHLDKFALELDLVSRTYSNLLVTEKAPESDKKPFTEEEIKKVWQMAETPWVDSIIVLLYSGFRISELLELKVSDVDLEQGIMRQGVKTDTSKNRIVPVHSRILAIIEKRMQGKNSDNYLFCNSRNKTMHPINYREIIWKKLMEILSMNYTPHVCRHTFRSRLDSANANKRCIDLIMGHKSKDVGERVYTHKTAEELKAAIELLE